MLDQQRFSSEEFSIDSSKNREEVLDGIRAIAVARVVIWHATGWWWVTWIVSSIPVMFVVTGYLLARSFSSNGVTKTLYRRWIRLQIPLVFWSLIVLTLSEIFGSRHSSWFTFVFPLKEPFSEVAGEWFTTPLWYVRAYLWILLLSPLLWRLTRNNPLVTMALGCAASVVAGVSHPTGGSVAWMIADLSLFGTFTSLGMHFFSKGLPRRGPIVVVVAMVSLLLGVGLAFLRPPLDGVVNNNHLLHMLLGIFWTFAMLFAGTKISRFSRTRIARELNRRSLSTYLWHAPVAWVLWQVVHDGLIGVSRAIVVTFMTFLVIPLVTRSLGELEDVWHRTRRIRTLAFAFSLLCVLVAPVVLAHRAGRLDFRSAPSDGPLPPSQAPVIEKVRINPSVMEFVKGAPSGGLASARRQEQLHKVLEEARRNLGVRSLRAVVTNRNGQSWFGNTGRSRPLSTPSFVGSITKTFTTALVMDAVERGEVTLDAPIGDLNIGFRYASITLRQLLRHRAGIPRTSVASGIIYDGVTPQDVARWVSSRPLDYEPGTSYKYSTTGFVLVGLVLEKATGVSYEQLLQDRIAKKFNLELDVFTGQHRSVGYSTGGVAMRLDELAKWARIYIDNRTSNSKPWPWAIRNTTGLGIHGYCPCAGDGFVALGHMGGRTFMSVDGDGVVVIVDTDGVLVGDNLSKTIATAQELRLVAGGGLTSAWTAE